LNFKEYPSQFSRQDYSRLQVKVRKGIFKKILLQHWQKKMNSGKNKQPRK